MKNYRKISFISLLTATMFLSCSKDKIEDNNKDNNDNNNNTPPATINVSNCSFILDANPSQITTLTPETLNNLCASNAMANARKGTSSSYTHFFRITPIVSQWSVFSGSGITFNDGELTARGATVKINFSENFTAGSVKAIGTLSTGELYGPILNFK